MVAGGSGDPKVHGHNTTISHRIRARRIMATHNSMSILATSIAPDAEGDVVDDLRDDAYEDTGA